jgi:hypothetical protein
MSDITPTVVNICITAGHEYDTEIMGYPAIGTYITSDGTRIFGYAAGLREMGEALLDLADAAENYQHNEIVTAVAAAQRFTARVVPDAETRHECACGGVDLRYPCFCGLEDSLERHPSGGSA